MASLDYLHCHMCESKEYKTTKRVDGQPLPVTRCCDRPCVKVNGGLYKRISDAPEYQIIKAFESYKRKENAEYSIEVGSSAWRDAVNAAGRILAMCDDGDLELALVLIDVVMGSEKYEWYGCHSLHSILSGRMIQDFLVDAINERASRKQAAELQRSMTGGVEAWGDESVVTATDAALFGNE